MMGWERTGSDFPELRCEDAGVRLKKLGRRPGKLLTKKDFVSKNSFIVRL